MHRRLDGRHQQAKIGVSASCTHPRRVWDAFLCICSSATRTSSSTHTTRPQSVFQYALPNVSGVFITERIGSMPANGMVSKYTVTLALLPLCKVP